MGLSKQLIPARKRTPRITPSWLLNNWWTIPIFHLHSFHQIWLWQWPLLWVLFVMAYVSYHVSHVKLSGSHFSSGSMLIVYIVLYISDVLKGWCHHRRTHFLVLWCYDRKSRSLELGLVTQYHCLHSAIEQLKKSKKRSDEHAILEFLQRKMKHKPTNIITKYNVLSLSISLSFP